MRLPEPFGIVHARRENTTLESTDRNMRHAFLFLGVAVRIWLIAEWAVLKILQQAGFLVTVFAQMASCTATVTPLLLYVGRNGFCFRILSWPLALMRSTHPIDFLLRRYCRLCGATPNS